MRQPQRSHLRGSRSLPKLRGAPPQNSLTVDDFSLPATPASVVDDDVASIRLRRDNVNMLREISQLRDEQTVLRSAAKELERALLQRILKDEKAEYASGKTGLPGEPYVMDYRVMRYMKMRKLVNKLRREAAREGGTEDRSGCEKKHECSHENENSIRKASPSKEKPSAIVVERDYEYVPTYRRRLASDIKEWSNKVYKGIAVREEARKAAKMEAKKKGIINASDDTCGEKIGDESQKVNKEKKKRRKKKKKEKEKEKELRKKKKNGKRSRRATVLDMRVEKNREQRDRKEQRRRRKSHVAKPELA